MLCAVQLPASAQARPIFWLLGHQVAFPNLVRQDGAYAIAVDDPGLKELLNRLGATVTWGPRERYVLFTTAEPVIVSFAVGDPRYDVGPVTQQAGFAPFVRNGVPYVPFDELMRALDLAPVRYGGEIVLQPQLAAIDVRGTGSSSKLVAHAGIPLDYRVVSQSADRIVLEFYGVASTLEPRQIVQAAGLREIGIRVAGNVRNPRTLVTLVMAPGSAHGPPGTDDQRDFVMSFAGAPATLAGAPAALAAASPQPTAAVSAAVTSLQTQATGDTYTITVGTSGSLAYEWHRLRPPDNRWWINLHDARLAVPPQNTTGSGPVQMFRISQNNPNTVRLALSLPAYESVDVQPNPNGLTIVVGTQLADEAASHDGGGIAGVGAQVGAVAATPPADLSEWKFGPHPASTYVPTNPRLIVIDPGHGGSDAGAVRGDLEEKNLTLDMGLRLRDILLARGWQVKMTRTTDRDVYKPNDSARAELQARDNIANDAGAAMFVSIHVNSYINAGPSGTTTYYSKPSDVPLAQAVERRLIAELGTRDDGIVKSRLYVTLHAHMPAILVETAFLSNPDDYKRLASPAFRQKVAQAIAEGIGDYAGAPPPPPVGDR